MVPTLHDFNLSYSWNKNRTERIECSRDRCIFGSRECFAHHPQDGARGLLHLLGSTPPGFDSRQTKISYFHCEAFMKKYIWSFVKETAQKIESTVLCCLTWPASAACFIWNKGKGILWQPCFNEHLTLNQSRCCSFICGFIFMVSWDRNQQFIAIHGCLNNWEREIAQSSHNSERKILKKQLQGQVSIKIKSISITFSGRSPEI